jgi:hypothetical protein
MTQTPTTRPAEQPAEYLAYQRFLRRLESAPRRYDMPAISTRALRNAVQTVVDRQWFDYYGDTAVLDLIDVIRVIVGEPTTRDVVIGCELVGLGYDADAIRIVCQLIRSGSTLDQIVESGYLDPADREAVGEVLGG